MKFAYLPTVVTLLLVGFAFAQAEEEAAEPKSNFADLFNTDEDAPPGDREHEQKLVKQLYAGADEPEAALAAIAALPKRPTELELRGLRNLDRELARSDDALHRKLLQQAVIAMAGSGDGDTLQYLHKVFDSQPERHASVAAAIAQFALAKQRRPHDWPLLVRSLTVVKDDDAVVVLKSLLKFRERGTSPPVQRNALLVGLELADDRATHALKVLQYWTGASPARPGSPIDQQLAAWQAWYHEKYPMLPEAKLPVDDPSRPHKFAEVLQHLESDEGRHGDEKRGQALFESALCIKCHQVGERGERVGPNLTKVSKQLTRAELLQSLLFPSHQVLDQYATKQLELNDGKVITGIVGENGDSLIVLPADGVKQVIVKSDIASIAESPLSAMPSNLLDKLSRQEIADLFAYLYHIPE